MKLYTRTGDDGSTGLFGGERARKDHPRVEAYGAVDELNATVGFALSACKGSSSDLSAIVKILVAVQSRLFDLGADLATPVDSQHRSKMTAISDKDVATAESWIDAVDGENTALTSFVLPGGSEVAARLHLARTTCRQAERRVLTLSCQADVNPEVIKYLNRLSDLLFAMARRANAIEGVPDVEWRPGDR